MKYATVIFIVFSLTTVAALVFFNAHPVVFWLHGGASVLITEYLDILTRLDNECKI